MSSSFQFKTKLMRNFIDNLGLFDIVFEESGNFGFCYFGYFWLLSTPFWQLLVEDYQISDILQNGQIGAIFFRQFRPFRHSFLAFAILATFGHFLLLFGNFWLRTTKFPICIWYLEDPICHQSPHVSQIQNLGFFWILVASSTLKLNDLIWAKNAKSWIPSSSSWGPINVAHLKNFGILDRHALQFLNVYSSVHPSIFKNYVSQVL